MYLIVTFLLSVSALAATTPEDLAYQNAPIIFQATDEEHGDLDYIAAVDFDGDLQGNNNWESATEHPFLPVVYYAVVSTDTHHFITYSLFHARDWATWCSGIFYECHENDMENFQIVVDRSTGKRVAVVTQAHFWSSLYLNEPSDEADGEIIDVEGRVGVFVESRGHAIYGLDDDNADVKRVRNGYEFSDGHGVVYVPNRSARLYPPSHPNERGVSYHLVSTRDKFWNPILRGDLVGEGKLFNGSFDYADEMMGWDNVPRYFDSDMRSGIGKSDAGIVPFAMGFSLFARNVGGLFFNPAFNYRASLTIASDWSLNYTYHPYW